MNYTQNYHLPQWDETDRVLMQDFNAAMAGIETGITASKTTADTALETAETASTAAAKAYTPDFAPYAVGTYDGLPDYHSIHVGFQPSAVILRRKSSSDTREAALLFMPPSNNLVSFFYNGFSVAGDSLVSGSGTFAYIAFR